MELTVASAWRAVSEFGTRHAKLFLQRDHQLQRVDRVEPEPVFAKERQIVGDLFLRHFQHQVLDHHFFDLVAQVVMSGQVGRGVEWEKERHSIGRSRATLNSQHATAMKHRLDQLLVARGLCESREKAQRAIMAGEVSVGDQVVDKPGTRVAEDAAIIVKAAERYVGRGGLKTGGGARRISRRSAGQGLPRHRRVHRRLHRLPAPARRGEGLGDRRRPLAARLENPQRPARGRARKAQRPLSSRATTFREPIEVCVIDVSFISLTLILPPAFALLSNGGVIVPLIKPQFELRKEEVGRGGVVRDAALHERAVEKIRAFVDDARSGRLGGLHRVADPRRRRQQGISRMSARRIGLIANDGKPGAGELTQEIVREFARHGLPADARRAHRRNWSARTPRARRRDSRRACDLLVVLGGDGTILQVLHDLEQRTPPIFGINLGTLGFLTCVSSAQWLDAVDAIVQGNYILSERTLLSVEVIRDGAGRRRRAPR